MKIFKLKDLIDNKSNPKIVKKILDSTELSKLDKKDILNDLKNISNGDSIDDGMEYYLVLKERENGGLEIYKTEFNVISSISGGEITMIGNLIVGDAFCIYNKLIRISTSTGLVNMKERFINALVSSGLSLDNPEHFKKITAEEYYSLIKN